MLNSIKPKGWRPQMADIKQFKYKGVTYNVAEYVPELPIHLVAQADMFLQVTADGTAVQWTTLAIVPALPSAEGDYKLHIDAQGVATWVAIV